MNTKAITNTQRITISAMVMALYIAILYFTQSFSFGAYQIRIATTLYALSYFFPFLILPLGLSNLISNMLFGGLGPLDMFGGCLVGMVTATFIVLIRQKELPHYLAFFPILLVPGFGVATWLSYLLKIPYLAMVLNLCVGQSIPAICGVILIQVLRPYMRYTKFYN